MCYFRFQDSYSGFRPSLSPSVSPFVFRFSTTTSTSHTTGSAAVSVSTISHHNDVSLSGSSGNGLSASFSPHPNKHRAPAPCIPLFGGDSKNWAWRAAPADVPTFPEPCLARSQFGTTVCKPYCTRRCTVHRPGLPINSDCSINEQAANWENCEAELDPGRWKTAFWRILLSQRWPSEVMTVCGAGLIWAADHEYGVCSWYYDDQVWDSRMLRCYFLCPFTNSGDRVLDEESASEVSSPLF